MWPGQQLLQLSASKMRQRSVLLSLSLAGQTFAQLNVETWLCHGPELSSVGEASTLQHQSSGMPSLSTSVNIHQSRTIQSWVENPFLQPSLQHPLITFCFKSVLYLLTYLLVLEDFRGPIYKSLSLSSNLKSLRQVWCVCG